jgi:hypothetical protein
MCPGALPALRAVSSSDRSGTTAPERYRLGREIRRPDAPTRLPASSRALTVRPDPSRPPKMRRTLLRGAGGRTVTFRDSAKRDVRVTSMSCARWHWKT